MYLLNKTPRESHGLLFADCAIAIDLNLFYLNDLHRRKSGTSMNAQTQLACFRDRTQHSESAGASFGGRSFLY